MRKTIIKIVVYISVGCVLFVSGYLTGAWRTDRRNAVTITDLESKLAERDRSLESLGQSLRDAAERGESLDARIKGIEAVAREALGTTESCVVRARGIEDRSKRIEELARGISSAIRALRGIIEGSGGGSAQGSQGS